MLAQIIAFTQQLFEMLPPVLVSLPFKLLLFVMVDGWALVVHSLLTSFR